MTIAERLDELQRRSERDISGAMHSGCTDYYCDCHLDLPRLIAALRESERRDGARARDMHAAEQSLAKALGYPQMHLAHFDGKPAIVGPEHAGAVATGDYCAGEQTLATLAVEAMMAVRDLRARLTAAEAANGRLRAACEKLLANPAWCYDDAGQYFAYVSPDALQAALAEQPGGES